MSHEAAASMTRWQIESSKAVAGTRTLQFTSLSFDVSFQEIFSTLSSGGTLVVISEETRRDDKKLMRFLTEAAIARLFVPFVMLRQLGERVEMCEALPASLQEVMTAGEQLKITPEIETLFSKLSHCLLYNHYGPSETHAATSLTLSGPARGWPRIPSIGYPVPHAQVYILDERLHLVPVGVSGELYIGGAGLARGYLNRPDLTADRFVPDPFGQRAGARLYKSGDLARYRGDGRIEFLGRKDQQVKVRGFRIELGEIETALKHHEDVREAVAVAWEPKPGEKRLAAYVVLDSRADVSIAELRAHLKDSLPEYMLPSAFIKLSELPLTASGKVNHRALPPPDRAAQESSGDYVAPRNQVEDAVAAIWAEVLGVERVGITDNFFDLGGHSLLATQLVSRLQDAFKVEVPLRRLFEYPTVESLGECIDKALLAGLHLDAPPLCRVSRDEPLPLSFAQQRLWFLSYVDAGNTAYNMPATLRMEGALDLKALEESFTQIVKRHEVLRTSFAAVDGTPVQVINPPADIHLPLVDLSELPRARREAASRALAIEEARRPFDLTRSPLLRLKVLRLCDRDHVLLVTMHHIVSDGWSIGIIIRELAAIYEARLRGEPPPLADLPIQYADFAVWQREWLKGEALDRQLDYWKQQLEGDTPVLTLPTDRPRQAVQTFRGASITFSVPGDISGKLKDFARREGATLFMSLLAAFQVLLRRYSGQHDIAVGTPIANRSRRELEGLIGFFVNTLVIRTDLRATPTFRELIRRVQEVTLGGYAHQDVPFEKLVEELQPERDLSHSPLFQVAFALQNAPIPQLELAGLALSPLETESITTKFDLVFSLEEKEQGLQGVAEYNTDLFDRATVERMTKHFGALLEAGAANPDQRIDRLQMLTRAEQSQLLEEWNRTAADYPSHKCIHHLFEEQVGRTPDAVAAIFDGERTTYSELNNQSNRLARHLCRLRIGRGATVGVFLDRSLDMVVSVLGVIKSGAAYVPVDVSWPQERILSVLSSLDIGCLLTQYAQLRNIHDLQWKLPKLSHVVCLDVETEQPAAEPIDRDVVQGLWDRVAEEATDRISAGGFTSSYTGEAFSEAEVDEYVSRVIKLAEPFLGPEKRVLEIGCGAGIVMFEIAPRVGQYVGLDPSEVTQQRNRLHVADAGISNIELVTGFAHETSAMRAGSFDLIVIASAAQFFPGPLYFQQVIAEALRLLTPGGRILLADILDARRKEEFRESLVEFRSNHPEAKTKTDIDRELYFDEDYFHDLGAKQARIANVEVMYRRNGYASELGFRYDVLIKKVDSSTGPVEACDRAGQKNLWTRWHLRQLSEENPHNRLTADDLAYIIFTSGSTGVPKGIAVNHKAVVNVIDWVNKTYRVGAGDELLFVTSLCFDLSVYDIFGILAAGATIHVASVSDLRDPERLVEKLCNEGITFWDSAPAALQRLAPFFPTGDSADGKHSLRLVFLSGDWIPLSLPGHLRAAFAGAEVISLGGATEAAIWSNSYPVDDIKPQWASIPYGKPIQNARYYILDDGEDLCPVGVPGQLFIGGDCLALGYTDPILTAEKFVPAAFGGRAGARLYKTGDRARWWPDGNIEFLGRIDHQVKVRGFRIELGEIESALAKHPAVRQPLVIAREDAADNKRLVAYVTIKQGQTVATNELRRFLKQKLPDYMVPSGFIFLDSMPLTRNGKVDRERLPDPRSVVTDAGDSFVAPASELEQAIAAIWQETLGVERVSAYDNFFDLGGHSLLMVQVYTRLREILRTDLSIIDLFKYPTISSLAEYLSQEKGPSSRRSEQDRGKARRQSIASQARLRNERQQDRRHGRS
jgi:amino acid adenylation domain-containing protein